MNRTPLYALLLIGTAIIVVPIIVWFRLNFEKVHTTVDLPPRSEAAYNPLYALQEALRVDDIKVESRPRLTPASMDLQPGDTVLLLEDPLQITPGQTTALLSWVESGGHLLLRTPPQRAFDAPTDSGLLDALGVLPIDESACEPLRITGEDEHIEFCEGQRFLVEGPVVHSWGNPVLMPGHDEDEDEDSDDGADEDMSDEGMSDEDASGDVPFASARAPRDAGEGLSEDERAIMRDEAVIAAERDAAEGRGNDTADAPHPARDRVVAAERDAVEGRTIDPPLVQREPGDDADTAQSHADTGADAAAGKDEGAGAAGAVTSSTTTSGLVYARLARGRGTVDVLADMDFMHNANAQGSMPLLYKDGKRPPSGLEERQHMMLARLLLQPNYGKGVVHLVYSSDRPSLWRTIVHQGWPMWLPLLLALLAWLWQRAQRFGSLQPSPPDARRSLLEHVRASGELLLRFGRAPLLHDAVKRAFLSRLRRRSPLAANLQGDAQVTAIAELLQWPHGRVRDALTTPASNDVAGLRDRIRLLIQMRTLL